MKKALKVIAIVFAVFIVGVFVVAVLVIKTLPSPWEIKQIISPKKAQSPEFVQSQPKVTPAPAASAEKSTESMKSRDEKVDDGKARSLQVLKEDFMNTQKPLSSVCTYLPAAEKSHFLRKDDSGSANEFMKSLSDEGSKDPLVESAAPLFRYLVRLDGMRDLLEMIEKADAENDTGILKKAEFYTKLAMAGQEIRSNKGNIDRLLMKSYNLYILARAVGRHPELARDPATLDYCDQIEKNINLNLDFNPDEQTRELQKFLEYAKVDPKEVDFDQNYRSDVSFNFTDRNLTLNHTWIDKLFEKDIEKAKKELKAAPSEVPNSTSRSTPPHL